MQYIDELQLLGLKKQEAEIYLACLKFGMAKVSEIDTEVDAPRTSIYLYLRNLIDKGYIRKSKKQGVEYFIPSKPSVIQKNAEEKIKKFSRIVPKIDRLLDFSSKKPRVEYFDTLDGLIRLYEMMTNMNYKQLPYLIESAEATKNNFDKMGWELTYKFQKKFLNKNIITQGIITKNTLPILQSIPEKIKKLTRQRPATVKVINDEIFPFLINLYLIYPNKSFIVVPQENFVIMIENKNIYQSLVALYRILYNSGQFIDIKKI